MNHDNESFKLDNQELAMIDRDIRATVERTTLRQAFLSTEAQEVGKLLHFRASNQGFLATPTGGKGRRLMHRQAIVNTTAFCVFFLFIFSMVFVVIHRPQQVDAQTVWEKTVSATLDPLAAGVRSYHVKRVISSVSNGQKIENIIEKWLQLPNLVRKETTVMVNGTATSYQAMGIDGRDQWSIEHSQYLNNGKNLAVVGAAGSPDDQQTRVRGQMLDDFPRLVQPASTTSRSLPPSPVIPSVPQSEDDLLQHTAACYHPTMQGEGTIAGRKAFILDLGSAICPPPGAPPAIKEVLHTLWIDKETFFVLKDVAKSPAGETITTSEVASIEFNIAISQPTFSFDPSHIQDAIIDDVRPQSFQSAQPPRKYTPGHEPGG